MAFKTPFSYLPEQFADLSEIFDAIRRLVESGDFTLGLPLLEFEEKFAALIGTKHAIGVGSGTDALKLPLMALGIGPGDEVITAANTFIATVGAINETGARPVLIDCDDSFCMDVNLIEPAITERTKAVMPVHLTGEPVDMAPLTKIVAKHGLAVIEDACQAILAETGTKRCGTWGRAAGFSLHPLKNLNVWGDAGVVVTDDDELDEKLRLLRNHGLKNRDEVALLGLNSRFDSVQAVVGNWLIGKTAQITEKRIENAAYFDEAFAGAPHIRLPARRRGVKCVYHLYMVFAEGRDDLLNHCLGNGVEAKIHYPIPLYRQEGLKHLGYKAGDFPVADRHAGEIISFPVNQHMTRQQLDHVIETVLGFHAGH